ncbi:MAG TPA: hypothetical protein VIJ39_09080 [Solirubrobacteraceae bacterium]
MAKNPWTDPDPQPGDFDAYLATINPDDVDTHAGNPNARLTVVVKLTGEDATRLERIATQRGQDVSEVISDLLRDAERHAA